MGDARDATFASLCVFSFFPSRGAGKSRSLRERNFLLRAQRRKSGVVVFLRLGANDARAIFGEICVLWVFVRAKRVEFCAREEERWMVPARLRIDKREGGGHAAGFSLFFLLLVFHFSLTRKLFFLLKKHSHRKRRLKSRRSWARSKSKTARSRNGFA